MSERERENGTDITPLKHPDMTATERWLNYSHSIQEGVWNFLAYSVGQTFEDRDDLADQTANSIVDKKGRHPSTTTAKRWIRQLTAKNEEFQLAEQAAGIVIWRRPKEPR